MQAGRPFDFEVEMGRREETKGCSQETGTVAAPWLGHDMVGVSKTAIPDPFIGFLFLEYPKHDSFAIQRFAAKQHKAPQKGLKILLGRLLEISKNPSRSIASSVGFCRI